MHAHACMWRGATNAVLGINLVVEGKRRQSAATLCKCLQEAVLHGHTSALLREAEQQLTNSRGETTMLNSAFQDLQQQHGSTCIELQVRTALNLHSV